MFLRYGIIFVENTILQNVDEETEEDDLATAGNYFSNKKININ